MLSPVSCSMRSTIRLAAYSTRSSSSSSSSEMNGIVSLRMTRYRSRILSNKFSITLSTANRVYHCSLRVFISRVKFSFYHRLSSLLLSSISRISGFNVFSTKLSNAGTVVNSNKSAIGSQSVSNMSFCKNVPVSYL